MASAGTLITDLDGAVSMGALGSGSTDTDIVAQIMAEINTTSGGGAAAVAASPPVPRQVMNAPNPNTITHNVIDPTVATAHIIGNRQPSPADFAALMGAGAGAGGAAAYAPLAGPGFFQGQGAAQQQQIYMPQQDVGPTKGLLASLFPTGSLLRELKTPILVAIIFCLMSLPVVNVMMGHYFPRLLRIGGDLTMVGLGAKSLLAGALFFVIQRVLVPLVTN
jgi:hypothetical protein